MIIIITITKIITFITNIMNVIITISKFKKHWVKLDDQLNKI